MRCPHSAAGSDESGGVLGCGEAYTAHWAPTWKPIWSTRVRSQLKAEMGVVSCCILDCASVGPADRLLRSSPWQ